VAAGVYGSAITTLAKLQFDATDLASTVTHERRHVENSWAMENPATASLQRDVFLDIANQFFSTVPAAQRTAINERAIRFVAQAFANELDEVLVSFEDLKDAVAAGAGTSWFKVNQDAAYLAQNWETLLSSMVQGKDFAGVKLNLATSRAAVVARLQEIYDNLPPQFALLRGGTWNLGTNAKRETTTISPRILRPE